MGNKLIFIYKNFELIYNNRYYYWVIYDKEKTKQICKIPVNVKIEDVKFADSIYFPDATFIHMYKDIKGNKYAIYPHNPTKYMKYKKYIITIGIYLKIFYIFDKNS